jgi:hypothetical protein
MLSYLGYALAGWIAINLIFLATATLKAYWARPERNAAQYSFGVFWSRHGPSFLQRKRAALD